MPKAQEAPARAPPSHQSGHHLGHCLFFAGKEATEQFVVEELFVPGFVGERKRSTRPAMRALTADTARACIHVLMPARPLSGRPVTPDTPFVLLILILK